MASIGKKTPAGKSKLKPSTLLGGHRGREPNKFQFDVTVDNVIGGSKAEYSVKWCRGVKTASTRHFQAEPKQKDGVAINQKLSLLCTLYRAKATEAFDFEPKDSKLSLISHKGGKKNEKTVGKTHFNLSNFAGVPSATTPHSFQLNAKTTINVTITCTFVRVSRGTASSCGSGLSGMTVSSGDLGGDRRGNDDFADMDDVPSPVAPDVLSPVSSAVDTPASSPAKPPPLPEGKGRPYTYEDEETPLHIFSHASPTAAAQSPKRSISGRVGSMKGTGRESSKNKAKLTALASEVEQLQHQLAESQRETEKSRVLHQMSEDIIRELREKIEFSHGSRTGPAGSRATELQKKVDELEKRLATSGVESKQMKGGYESRIVMLNTQVETMERAKARLDGENKAVREQLATLETTKASSVSGNESSRKEAEARQKLLAETSDLRKENERLAREADMNSQRVTRLELENKETSRDMERLHEKLDAHEQHALQVKDTYEELSKMYSDLRDDHTKVHSELMEARQRAKAAATAAAASSLSPRSTSFAEKSRRLMRSHKDKDKGEKGDTTEATTERESESWEIEIEEAKAELQKQKVLLVNAERATNDAEKQAANLECDLGAAVEKIESTRRDVDRLMERLETSKAKHMNANEQHEAAMQSVVEQKVEMKALKKQFQADLQQLRVEKLEESKKLRQAALQNAEIASKGNDDERIRNLEESLAEAAIREDQYEEEILKLTQIMDGLSNKLTETKALVDSAAAAEAAEAEVPGEVAAPSGSRSIPGASAASNAPAAALSRCQCSAATQCNANFEADDRKREDAPQITIKRTRTGLGFFMGSKKPVTSNDDDNFISSSKIRQMNLFEKITDGRLLNMLVETKMKLAIAEEEKVRTCRSLYLPPDCPLYLSYNYFSALALILPLLFESVLYYRSSL